MANTQMSSPTSNAFDIITAVADALFEPEERRLSREKDRLCDLNQEAHKTSLDGFMFQGCAYRHSSVPPGGNNFRTLHLSIWDEMAEFTVDQDRIEQDKHRIQQLLFRLIQCHVSDQLRSDIANHPSSYDEHIQHVRDAIPDCIADLLPEPYKVDRMNSLEGSIDDPRVLREYRKTLPKIQEYAATRLLF